MRDILDIRFSDDAENDLDRLDEETQISIEIFLEEVLNKPAAMLAMARGSTHYDPWFDTVLLGVFARQRYNVSRLKSFESNIAKYRYLYTPDFDALEFYFMAIAERLNLRDPQPHQYDYEPDHPITRRVIDCYESQGFPKLSR